MIVYVCTCQVLRINPHDYDDDGSFEFVVGVCATKERAERMCADYKIEGTITEENEDPDYVREVHTKYEDDVSEHFYFEVQEEEVVE